MTAEPTFRFDRVLRVKTLLRKAAQDEVVGLRREIDRLEGEISAAEAARDESRARALEAALDGPSAADLQVYATYDLAQAMLARTLHSRVEALGEVLEQRRTALLERRREERQFEVLRDRVQTRRITAAARAEGNFQDELAQRSTGGGRAGGGPTATSAGGR
jgi:flagellar export protein FliJ